MWGYSGTDRQWEDAWRGMELGDSAKGELYFLRLSEEKVYELGTVIVVLYFLAHPSVFGTIYALSLLIHKSTSQQSTMPGFVSGKR